MDQAELKIAGAANLDNRGRELETRRSGLLNVHLRLHGAVVE